MSKDRRGSYGNPRTSNHYGASGGRTGTDLNMFRTKDRMGFDYEIVNRCEAHEGRSQQGISRHRRDDKKTADELSGAAAKRAKGEVTLAKFSWDE